MAQAAASPDRVIAQNRKARHNYFIEDSIEAGIVLAGSEVKSLREGRANIAEGYAREKTGEIWAYNIYIPEYGNAARAGLDVRRPRKLLLRKRQIDKLASAIQREGVTLVPLKLYFNQRGIAKLLLGIARGKRKYDKRQSEKEKDWKRQQGRLMRDRG